MRACYDLKVDGILILLIGKTFWCTIISDLGLIQST